jgi:hypothetical protein
MGVSLFMFMRQESTIYDLQMRINLVKLRKRRKDGQNKERLSEKSG